MKRWKVYDHFLENYDDIESGNFNAGFENISIGYCWKNEKDFQEITITKSNDPRSYRQNSEKLLKTGFIQNFSVDDAINEIIEAYNLKSLKKKKGLYFTSDEEFESWGI